MKKLQVNGATIAYQCLGRGRDVVLIHGLASCQGFWGPNLLMPLARRYRVTLLDLRGHGQSSMPPSGYTSAELAADVAGLLRHLGINEAHLIGHSFGGTVAVHCSLLFPELVSSMVLADCRLRIFQPHLTGRELLANEAFSDRLDLLGLKIPEGETEAGIWLLEELAKATGQERPPVQSDRKFFTPFGDWQGGRGRLAARRWLTLLERTSARLDFKDLAGMTPEQIVRIRRPVYSICGAKSVARQTQDALSALLPGNCRTELLADAGHFFPLTHPQEFIAKIHAFFASIHRERRETIRVYRKIPIQLRQAAAAGLALARTINLSIDGLLVECTRKLEVGAPIDLVASDESPHQADIFLHGRIVRVREIAEGKGMQYGIQLYLPAQNRLVWKRFLAV